MHHHARPYARHVYKSPDRTTCWLRVISLSPSIGILHGIERVPPRDFGEPVREDRFLGSTFYRFLDVSFRFRRANLVTWRSLQNTP
ncbi:hypothetical protein ANTQUA_LOCUS2767 [Anthophora quadrimaculata]